MKKKYYYVYLITNLVDGKKYIGCHQTFNIDDSYMGSGLYIPNAIEKYGIENFSKDILLYCDSSYEMFLKESKIVDENFIARCDTYNIRLGGNGGWDHCNFNTSMQKRKNVKSVIKQRELRISEPQRYDKVREAASRNFKSMHAKRKLSGSVEGYRNFKGKTHSDDTRIKIGLKNSEHQKGEGNSQFGTIWVCSLKLNVSFKIPKEKYYDYMLEGFCKGRINTWSKK